MAVVEGGESLGVALPDEGDQLFVGKEQVLSSAIGHTPTLRELGSAGSPPSYTPA